MNERQKQILSLVEEKNIITLKELITICQVSEATIRRDLTLLEEKNLIYRTHGGAAKKTLARGVENSLDSKKTEYVFEKREVAKYINKNFVKNGQTIYLDAGTSTYELIDYLRGKNVTVVTNSVYNLEKLIQNKIHTIMLGGTIKHSTYAVVGLVTAEQISKYSFDACFVGCNGIDHDFGLSTADEAEAYIKSIVLQNSKSKYILADESKFGHRKFQKFADVGVGNIISYRVPIDFQGYENIIEVRKKEDN